jgi:hypothetical protein
MTLTHGGINDGYYLNVLLCVCPISVSLKNRNICKKTYKYTEEAIKNRQYRKTGNKTEKQNKNTTQYVLDTTVRK